MDLITEHCNLDTVCLC